MPEPAGVLGEIVARKRVEVAARLAGGAPRGSADATRACARPSPGPARASSWR